LKTRRIAVAGVAAFTFALAASVAGCATKNVTSAAASPTPSASPSPTPNPWAVLRASTKSLATASYKFTVQADGLTGTGSTDGARDVLHEAFSGREQNVPVAMDIIIIDFDMYMRVDSGPLTSARGVLAGKYLHIDTSKLGENSTLPVFPGRGPLDVAGLMVGLVDVRTTDGRSFSGTVDLAAVTGEDAPAAAVLEKAGDRAKSVPFTATLDDQGQMTHLKIDGSTIDPQLVVEATFSDFGKAADVTAPDSSQVVEAPAAVMQMFQSP
jgi:hypothetical protein